MSEYRVKLSIVVKVKAASDPTEAGKEAVRYFKGDPYFYLEHVHVEEVLKASP